MSSNDSVHAPKVNPVDLKVRFGGQYRIDLDPAYYAEYGEKARTLDPWYYVVLCRYGHIFPYGGDQLAASTNRRGSIAKRLADLECCRVVQDGSDGITVVFSLDDFSPVAELIQPRLRRRLSAARRAALLAAGREHQFGRDRRV